MGLGTYLTHDGRPAVRFERTYPQPIERVWTAVSDPNELAHWFPARVTIEARVGGAVVFSGDPNAEDATGVVLAFDPPRHLAFTWMRDELHFGLEPLDERQCRLTLTNVLADRSAAARNAAGWSVCLGELDKHIGGRPANGPHSGTAASWQAHYDTSVAAGMPSGAEIPAPVGQP